MINLIKAANITVFLLFSLFTASSCKLAQPVFNARWTTSEGLIQVSIISVDSTTGKNITQTIKDDFAYMDKNWRAESLGGDLYRVNMLLTTGKTVFISPSLLPLIKLGQYFAEHSGGLFNPAMGKLFGLWGFHSPPVEHHPIPNHSNILTLVRSQPEMRDLVLKGVSLRSSNPDVKLDFSWMLRGYGVDLAIARLREFGIRSGTVKADGVIRVIGNRDGQPWRIPVHRPVGEAILGVVELFENESLATIGSDERSFFYDNQLYHELLDPRTGYPAREIKAIVVLHHNAVTADAAAHALFIAGPKHWKQVAIGMKVRHVLLMTADGYLYMTPAMSKRLKLADESQIFEISQLPGFDMD